VDLVLVGPERRGDEQSGFGQVCYLCLHCLCPFDVVCADGLRTPAVVVGC
jgi:hypothetical protein